MSRDPRAESLVAGVLPELPAAEPVREREWPTMGAEAYVGLPGALVEAWRGHTEADPAAVLLGALVAGGCYVGGRRGVRIGTDRHTPRLFVLVVGATAKARKSTALGIVGAWLRSADPDWYCERHVTGIGSGEAWIDLLAPLPPTKGTAPDGKPFETPMPAPDPRLLVVEQEFGRLLVAAGRESSTLSPVVRCLWDGSQLASHTRGHGHRVADDHHGSILGAITADELERRLSATDQASGFANRFMIAVVRREAHLPFGGSPDQAVLDALATRLRAAQAAAAIGPADMT